MRTNINNQYFCFPLNVGGKLAAEIEGYADLDVNTGSCAIIDMSGIQIATSEDDTPLGDLGLEGELKKAIRDFYIDGAGHDLLANSIDWHEVEADVKDADGDFRYHDRKNEG